MNISDFISLMLPSFVLCHFDAIKYDISDSRIDIYLDEKSILPLDGCQYHSKGFTPATTIQDFPIRGKGVYLHIRRRKWQNIITKEIVSHQYDLTYKGTDLTEEFVAFLKATN